MQLLLQIITLIGSVAMLMYGMKVMSEGLQKMAGSKLSNVLGTMTTNRFSGVLTGVNYMDTISEFEKMGDYIINVEEAIYEKKHDK